MHFSLTHESEVSRRHRLKLRLYADTFFGFKIFKYSYSRTFSKLANDDLYGVDFQTAPVRKKSCRISR